MSEENKYDNPYEYNDETKSTRTRGKRKRRERKRQTGDRQKRRRKVPVKKILIGLFIVALICFVAGCAVVYSIIRNTPDINPENFYELLSENSTIYDQNGEKMEDLQKEGLRTNIPYSQMPKDLQNAVISIEDKTFWEHSGFNFTRLAGAALESVVKMEGARGTSTITQQLARNLYLDFDRSWTRKVKEAYYTVVIEKKLSKEQIIEAYLNTINMGFGAYGVQAAAEVYFGKDISELTIAEYAMLASIPQSPTRFAAVKRYVTGDVSESIAEEDILHVGEQYTLVYNDAFKSRQETTLKFMLENGYISEAQYNEAMAEDIREALNPAIEVAGSGISSYFSDYVVKKIREDLMDNLGIDESRATDMIFNGGLSIHSTLDMRMQKIAEKEFENNANFPTDTSAKKDKAGNIIDSTGRIMLYKYSNYFDEENNLLIPTDEYTLTDSGDLVLRAGKKLNFYKSKNSDGSSETTIDFKKIYVVEDKIFYSYEGGAMLVTAKYKALDDEKNLVISREFLEENPDYFVFSPEGTIKVAKEHYLLRQKVVQPQGAVVIIDQYTGEIKTMVGGRSVEGKMLFNRAINPNPPGSSIKPLAVYTPALVAGMSAATVVDDCESVVNGKVWPSNYNHKFLGIVSIRKALQESINVAAVKIQEQVGHEASIQILKDFGVTTLVESGSINDANPSALALGGMTNGIPPLEMAGAYACIANSGEYIEPACYTTVTNRKGDVILEAESSKRRVIDQDVAYVMTNILRSVVTEGLAGRAQIGSVPVAGKTGTTSNNYDAWFCGFTPYYTAALWIGNDVDIDMREGSSRAASLWSKIMKQVHEGASGKSFAGAGSNIISVEIDRISGKLPTELSRQDPRGTVRTEVFVKGTEPVEVDDFHVAGDICNDSKFQATPYCLNHTSGVYVKRPEGWTGAKAADLIYELPVYYCNLHNPDPNLYPVSPDVNLAEFIPPPTVTEPEPDIDLDGAWEPGEEEIPQSQEQEQGQGQEYE